MDGKKIAELPASGGVTHHIIRRLCGLEVEVDQADEAIGVGFELRLPELTEGKHEAKISATF